MVDKEALEEKVSMREMLLQREQNRKEKIKNIKEEKELLSPDQVKLFHDTFDEHIENIMIKIKAVEDKQIDEKCLSEYFSKISKDIQVLNRYLSVSTVFLKNYSVRKCLKKIEDIETKLKELENEFLPRKKFGFKSRKAKVPEKSTNVVDEIDADINKIVSVTSTVFCGFSDKNCETLRLDEEKINKNEVELKNLTNCTIFLLGNPSTVHLSNVKECKVLSGPVSTSVFVENAQNCDLVIACQQLRIHSTTDSRFYIHVTSRAIIEDSTNVQFAPYNFHYKGIDEHYNHSGLDKSKNNWNQVDDFNWLASDAPSPNWSEIKESERVENWS